MDMVFLLFSLIQERQFLAISESICTLDHFVLVNCLLYWLTALEG